MNVNNSFILKFHLLASEYAALKAKNQKTPEEKARQQRINKIFHEMDQKERAYAKKLLNKETLPDAHLIQKLNKMEKLDYQFKSSSYSPVRHIKNTLHFRIRKKELVQLALKNPPEKSLKNRKWIFHGSQTNCIGAVSVSNVESIRKELDKQSPPGIQFNKNKVVSRIEGGTCSAMSLEFIEDYLKIRNSDDVLEALSKLGPKYESANAIMRMRQAAFNAIEITDKKEGIDYSLNKIQALANYHDIQVTPASDEIALDDMVKNKKNKEFRRIFSHLPEGIFLIRLLKSAANEKLEMHGHSMVYIKEKGLHLFYDPNFGVKNLSLANLDSANELETSFKKNFRAFEVNKARFYQIN